MGWRPVLLIAALFSCLSAKAAEMTAIPLNQPGQGAIIINGDLTPEDRENFLIKIAPFSGGMVVLNSRGGTAYTGMEIGKAIRMRGFTTWVPSGSFCASACAMAWLGGARRLMGKDALIGFHSVYRLDNGKPVETSSGNALYGAYLSQLGLSDRAIMFLSDAAPTSMNWLTPSEAEGFGITLSLFDPKSTTAEAQPEIKQAGSIETRSRDFIIALHLLVSGPTEKFLGIVNGLYSEEVLYYGKEIPRNQVIFKITAFANRWPIRTYIVQPTSVAIHCEQPSSQCRVTGLVDFDARSPDRQQWSHGVASFDYLLVFYPNSKWPLILSENGKVVTRQVDPLAEAGTQGPGSVGLPLGLSSH
jgi:hypothetical protein